MASKKPSSRRLAPHPAPGELRRVQDFVNTVELETGKDRLDSPTTLAAWLTRRKLLPAGARLDEAAWRQALEVRDGLRAVIGIHSGVRSRESQTATADPLTVEA